MNTSIGVVGYGMVGNQVSRWFKSKGFKVIVYDKHKRIGNLDKLNKCDYIFLCLPTAYNYNMSNGVDITTFYDIMKYYNESKVFVIKSTVPIGTTKELQDKLERHTVLHNPEFLTESTAWEDFSDPQFQLVGYHKKQRQARELLYHLPQSLNQGIYDSNTTELYKLIRNAYLATKVTFCNEVSDIAGQNNVSYNIIKGFMENDVWIGKNHTDVDHGGYRGFGGKCLPKDLRILNKSANSSFFDVIDKVNTDRLVNQGLLGKLNDSWLNNKGV